MQSSLRILQIKDWKEILHVVEALLTMTGGEAAEKKEARNPMMMESLRILSGKDSPKSIGTREAIEVNPA